MGSWGNVTHSIASVGKGEKKKKEYQVIEQMMDPGDLRRNKQLNHWRGQRNEDQ